MTLINEYSYNGGKIFKYKDKTFSYIFQTYSANGEYGKFYSKSDAEEFIDKCAMNNIEEEVKQNNTHIEIKKPEKVTKFKMAIVIITALNNKPSLITENNKVLWRDAKALSRNKKENLQHRYELGCKILKDKGIL